MDTVFINDFGDNDDDASFALLVEDNINTERQESSSSSLGISRQDSGLTDEDVFHSNVEEEEETSREISCLLDEEQSLFSGAWNAVPTTNDCSATSSTPKNTSQQRGPLSPFSPLLGYTQQQQEAPSTTISWQEPSDNLDDLSLQPCRKVSVMVKVKLPQQHDKLCLFPLLPPGTETTTT
jgi:hypothetical protein